MKSGKIISFLLEITKKLMVIFSTAMISIILYGVFRRYILNKAVPWSEELAIFLMIWIIYLGISVAEKEKMHIGMSALQDMLPDAVKNYLKLFINLLILIFLIMISYGGIRLSVSVIQQTSPALRLSFFWPYLSVPVGAMLMIIQILHSTWFDIRKIIKKKHYQNS